MSLRARIFIIISIIVLIILSVSIFLVVRNKTKIAVNNTPINSENNSGNQGNQPGASGNPATQIPEGLPVKPLTSVEIEQNGVKQLAKVFVERYGTYSTDNEFQNIIESEPLVTKALWSKISTGINAKNSQSEFLGLTTKVASVQLSSWTDAKAVLDLKTMRNQDKNGVESTRYQDVTVEMVKENNVWLANSIAWK